MPIITISRGSYSHGREVAEKLCARLGYECVSREVILKASEHFNIPELKLVRALHDAPSILDRFVHGKERYVAYFREALLHYLLKDNVVYHGLAGHFFVPGISHALKVRIIADVEDRVRVEKDRLHTLSDEEALRALERDDEERRGWSRRLYGIDTADPALYDMVIHIKRMSTDDAVEIIAQTAGQSCFQATPESTRAIRTLFLAAQVEASLVETIPAAKVSVENGEIVVSTMGYLADGKQLIAKVEEVIDDEKTGVHVKVRLSNRD
ncbi:MAG: AAA family ATPase [Syntrophobacteraceae bacterium]